MGRPVWTASNHFTTISPGGQGKWGRGEQGPEEKPVVLITENREVSAPL